ncbi:MAG TPA: TonB-dependent receptor plug domain-containing protein, partial [Limnobacter sp.]|nr:TonB-dependent receptor plug domain-containing protein [Limnobacter sp.]
MKPNQFKRHAVALACAILATPALAQVTVLESVIVTGSGIEADSITKPFSIISADELNASGASTLGEALRYQPGISATGFGPNSSRPIVRGQDSDRIKILRNSAPLVDASALSFDHALPVDPFSLHQVEILRGPAALAYGGNAVGGVVNLVDQRIARSPIQGFQAETSLLSGGAADQTAAGFKLGAGLGSGFSIHLDGFRRTARDLKTPSFTDPDGFTGDRVRNSAAKADGASIGLSKQTGSGYVGFSAEQYDNLYGVPKKLDVQIGMENQRYALEGEQNISGGLLTQVKYRMSKTDYQHQEFEEGLPATQFLNDGTDGRIELTFRPFSMAGLQVSTKA